MYLRCNSLSFQMCTGSVGIALIHIEIVGASALSVVRGGVQQLKQFIGYLMKLVIDVDTMNLGA